MSAITACFFRNLRELETLRAGTAGDSADIAWVALTPEGVYAAERESLPHTTIEEHSSEKELLLRGRENFERLNRLCDFLDRVLGCEPEPDPPFAGRYYGYQLKLILDNLCHRAHTLASTLRALSPRQVAYCFEPSDPHPARVWYRPYRLTTRMIPWIAQQLGLGVLSLPVNPDRSRTSSFLHRIRGSLDPMDRLGFLGSLLRRRTRSSSSRLPTILTTSWVDSPTVRRLRERGYRILRTWNEIPAESTPVRLRSDASFASLRSDPEWNDLFRWEGMNLLPLAEPNLRLFLEKIVPRHRTSFQAVMRVIRKVNPHAMLGSIPLHPEDVAAFVAARRSSVPTFIHQHGAAGYHEYPLLGYTDLQLADTYLCFGPGFRSAAAGPGAHPLRQIPVGSQELHQLLRRNRNGSGRARNDPEMRVLYVVTHFVGDIRYFSGNIYPDLRYWSLQRRVLELCASTPGVRLTVKLDRRDEIPNPLPRWAEDRRLPRCRFVRDLPFHDLLGEADLILIDYPSTTLLQALTTRKPVVLFADLPYFPLQADALRLLQLRVAFASTPEDFLREIAAALRRLPEGASPPVNDEFLEAHGVTASGPSPAERSAEAIHSLREVPGRGSPAPLAVSRNHDMFMI